MAMSEGIKTRAMAGVGKKGGETSPNDAQKPILTKSVTPAITEEGEVVSDSEETPLPPAKKRRKIQGKVNVQKKDHVFRKPGKPPVKNKISAKGAKGSSSSSRISSSDSSPSGQRKKVASKVKNPAVVRKENTHFKIDKMFEWFQTMQVQDDKRSKTRSRSRSHSRTRSRSRSRASSKSSYHSRSSGSYRSSKSDRSGRSRSYDSHRSHSSKDRHHHSMSSSDDSHKSEVDTIRDKDDDFNLHRARLVLGLAGSTTSEPPVLTSQNSDPLEQRISSTIADSLPKPSQGPDLTDRVSSLVRALVGKSDFPKVLKVCEKYPRPGNVPELVTPELTQDVDKTIDAKVVKEDKRLKINQNCATSATAALGKALDMVLLAKQQVPGLSKVGDILVDCITLTGFMHAEYNDIRLKGFKQTVNPSYSGIFSAKPEEPELLMGKAPIGDQIKSCDDLQKIKNKLKKHDSNPAGNRGGFRKGGDFKRKQNSGFQRNQRNQYNRRRYEGGRGRPFSPRKSGRKQSYSNENQFKGNSSQEDRKVSSRRN